MKLRYHFLSAALTAALVSPAMANQVLLKNASQLPMIVYYKVVHKHPGETITNGNISLAPGEQEAISFDLNNYALAGVAPTSITIGGKNHRLSNLK